MCRQLDYRRARVRLSDGERLWVLGPRVVDLNEQDTDRLPVRAQAYLAGCPRLLANRLAARLLRGEPFGGRTVRVAGHDAYRFILHGGRAPVRLDVSTATLLPVAISVHTRALHGVGRLTASARHGAP